MGIRLRRRDRHPAAGADKAIDLIEAAHSPVNREALQRPGAGSGAEPVPQFIVPQQGKEGLRHGGGAARRNHQAGISDGFGDPSYVRRHARTAAGHCLDHAVREALGNAGERNDAAGLVSVADVLDPALERRHIADAELRG